MKLVLGVSTTLLVAAVLIADDTADDTTGHITGHVTRIAGLPDPIEDADFHQAGPGQAAKVELGRLLFFDPILSGNRNISCSTCHHPSLATADGVALGFGEGAEQLGERRRAGTDERSGVHGRVPRNSPALFNLGAREYTAFFHDGRVEVDTEGHYDSGFVTPAKWKLPTGLDNALAAQAMFPVGSPEEMAGQKGENEIADAVSLNNMAGPDGVWAQLGHRLREIPEYVDRFRAAFPERIRDEEDITYVLAANAIAAFEAEAFRADASAFDEYLRGDDSALGASELRGMELFYGEAGCAGCHQGALQTDHDYHAIAMPQIGPGKGDGAHTGYWSRWGERAFLEDLGRGRVTWNGEDNFRFRTPSLRNVELTGPWGHDGAYATLEDVVRHHLDPVRSLNAYAAEEAALPPLDGVLEASMAGSALHHRPLSARRFEAFAARDRWVHSEPELRHRIAAANELPSLALNDTQVSDLLAFLGALTDPASEELGSLIPSRIPSGLPIER